MTNELTSLPNIGKELAKLLTQADIKTPDELISLGSENAFIRINTIDGSACFSKFCALEGAIQGIRWHNLDKAKKDELKEFFQMVKKK